MRNGKLSAPEHLLQLFDLVVGEFLGAAVVKEGPGVGEGPGVDLQWRTDAINPPAVITGLSRARYLDADAALQLELQADHVHLGRGAQQAQLGHLGAHLVDGHLDGAQVALVLVHDGDSLLHVRETVGGCRETELLFTSHKTHKNSSKRGGRRGR